MLYDLAVFMVTHNVKCNNKEKWIIPIQVGINEGSAQFEKYVDNIGDNISKKNNIFCELTALYWVWKNVQYKYIGLCHYRRKFKLDVEELLLCLNKRKIIVPKPKYFKISVKKQYIREHSNKEWDIMMQVLKEGFPDYYASSSSVFNNNKLYPYNMFIGDKRFSDEYCEWLFSVLFEVEKRVENTKVGQYQMRYIGFLAERLLTLYIAHNNLSVEEKNVLFNGKIIWQDKFKHIINNSIFRLRYKLGG